MATLTQMLEAVGGFVGAAKNVVAHLLQPLTMVLFG
jgi:hypothetical protein